MLVDFPILITEWDSNKNALLPKDIPAGSKVKVWWQCGKGHSWEAQVSNRVRGAGCPFCSGNRILPGFNDLATTHPEVAEEWHPTKNLPVQPTEVSSGSNRKFWWQDALGHEWFTTVNARKAGQGCPFCAGKKVLVGFNDLGTTNPKLATEWHHKNTVPFDSVTSKSSVKVWWQCEKNHEWQAPVYSRSNGNNCPYCAGKKTTYVRGILLVDKHPEIAKNFSTKNLISFEQVTLYEKTKYLWVCDFGHEWQGLPSIFRNGYTCPICKGKKVLPGVNDIATTHPEKVRRFWSFNKNSISPSEVSAGSDKRVWWVCEKGHDWQGTPNEVLGRNRGCPACAGKVIVAGDNDLRTLYPDIAEQWHPEKNKSLTPSKVTPGANKKIWWQCEKGHEWEALLNNRTVLGSGCPQCVFSETSSKGERELAGFLEAELNTHVMKSSRSVISPWELDIYLPDRKLAIEFNGVYWHSEANGKDKFYHFNKWKACKEQGIQLIQIWEDDWVGNKDLVKRMLRHKLGLQSTTTPGRKTLFVPVDARTAKAFLVENHLQGYRKGATYFGLVDSDNILVAVMGVTKKSFNVLEIARFATAWSVPGGFSKLLKHTLALPEHSNVTEVHSYSHNDYATGEVYASNGFVRVHEGTPGYFYIVKNKKVPRTQYMKSRFKNDPALVYEEAMTERELAMSNGLTRVWDSGSSLWVKKLV